MFDIKVDLGGIKIKRRGASDYENCAVECQIELSMSSWIKTQDLLNQQYQNI